MKACLSVLFLVALLSGCVSVRTTTTTFYTPEYKPAGTIAVVAAEAEVNNSLEFSHYKRHFENKLAANGYTIVNDPAEATFIALVSYGIDSGRSSIVSTPIFGQTGGGTTYSSGSVYGPRGSAAYSGTSYTMPTYGVVGSATSSVTQYTRAIALDIVEADSLRSGKPKKVYEGRARSTGSCGAISGVFEEILEAMFKDFPGTSGKSRNVEITSKGSC